MKTKLLSKTLSLFLVSMVLTSCATLFTGTKDRISFNSNPSGAMIYIDGVEYCRTPCSVSVKRSLNDTEVELKLDGYQTRFVKLSKEFNVISVLNLGNLLGWGIDAVTGSIFRYDKKSYEITFEANKVSMIDFDKIEINTQTKEVSIYKVD